MNFKKSLEAIDFQAMIPQLTLIWCLLNLTDKSIEYLPVRLMAAVLLLFPVLAAKSKSWLLMIGAYLIYFLNNLVVADNHRWLFLYFLISIYIAFSQSEKRSESFSKTLKFCAIPLIILCFSLALVWKLFDVNYVNSSFFEYVLAGGDNRLQDFVILALGYTPDDIKFNTYLINNFVFSNPITGFENSLIITGALKVTAVIFTYFALLIELVVPLLYLGALKKPALKKYASYSLLIFIVSVYFITPVYPFGQLLSLLGLAANDDKKIEPYFIGTFLLMILLNAPWMYLLA